MNQLLLGASGPFLLGVIVYVFRKFRATVSMLILIPVAMTAGMLWAVAPDLPRLFGQSRLYSRLAQDPRCDIFFWHYTIDKIESDSLWFFIAFVFMFATLLAIAWRELYLAEKGI